MNLFASFAANNFLWLIWYHVILDTNILEGKDQVCKYIFILKASTMMRRHQIEFV